MRKLLLATAIAIAATPAMAAPDYLCRVGLKSYPLSYDEVKGTMTWRGTTYSDLTPGYTGCKLEYTATSNGVTADLCMHTQGAADLTIGKDDFECQMPGIRSRR